MSPTQDYDSGKTKWYEIRNRDGLDAVDYKTDAVKRQQGY